MTSEIIGSQIHTGQLARLVDHHPSPQVLADQLEHELVTFHSVDSVHESIVVDRIEERLKVSVLGMPISLFYETAQFSDGIIGRPI